MPRRRHGEHALADGDQVEIVHAIGGGWLPPGDEEEIPSMSAVPNVQQQGDAGASAQRPLTVAGVERCFRLLVGTGGYRDFEETRAAIEASDAEVVVSASTPLDGTFV